MREISEKMGIRRGIKDKVEQLKDYLEREEEETDRLIAEQILLEELEEEEETEEEVRRRKPDRRSLREAVRSLEHIRWFLDHQKGYVWRDGGEDIRTLRHLMKDTEENREEIIETYLQILRTFLNDPFATFIILDDADEEAGKASSIDRFFVITDGMPVPLGFVRQFDKKTVSGCADAFERDRKAMRARAQALLERVKSIPVQDPEKTLAGQKKAGGFIFFAACISAVLLILAGIDILRSHYRPGVEFVKRYLPGEETFLQILKAEYNLRWYLFCAGMAALTLFMVFLVLVTVLRTVSRYINIKTHVDLPARKKQDLMNVFGRELPQDIDLLYGIILKGFDPDTPVQAMRSHDYREKVQMIDELECSEEEGMKKPVTAAGRILVIFCVLLVLWFAGKTAGLLPDTTYGQWAAEGYVTEYDLNR